MATAKNLIQRAFMSVPAACALWFVVPHSLVVIDPRVSDLEQLTCIGIHHPAPAPQPRGGPSIGVRVRADLQPQGADCLKSERDVVFCSLSSELGEDVTINAPIKCVSTSSISSLDEGRRHYPLKLRFSDVIA